jgi:hypothetical protein
MLDFTIPFPPKFGDKLPAIVLVEEPFNVPVLAE